MKKFDVCVIGGGVIGLCAAYYSLKKNKQVLLIEKNTLGTQDSSSAGHVRMWRTVYDDIEHSKLAYLSGELFKELETVFNTKFINMNGLLNFGTATESTPEGTLLGPIKVLEEMKRPYEKLSKEDIENIYPFKDLPNNYMGLYSPDNGTIDVKNFIGKLSDFIKKNNNCTLLEYSQVSEIKSLSDGACIIVNEKLYLADKVIITTSAFTNKILSKSFGFELNFIIWDMAFSYYKLTGEYPEEMYPMFFQFENPKNGYSDLFYGFPSVNFARKGFIRIAVDWASHKFSDVDVRELIARPLDITLSKNYIVKNIKGVDPTPIDVAKALFVDFPDNIAVLDFIPKTYNSNHNIVLCLGGWSFKFAPLFGKACSDLVLTGSAEFSTKTFSILRDGIIKKL